MRQAASKEASLAFHWLRRLWRSFSGVGLCLGTLFFAASLTPSLVPRGFLVQGVLSGLCFAIGYGLGVAWRWLWGFLELPEPHRRQLYATKLGAAVICIGIGILFLWRAVDWQNSIRGLMGMAPVDTGHPLEVGLIALASFLIVLGLARLFYAVLLLVSDWLKRVMPIRVAYVLGTAVATVLFWTAADGLLLRYALRFADSSFERLDSLIPPETLQPADPGKTGSAASLVRWEDLGRMGRDFIATGPTAAEIGAFTGRPAKEPVRVYVGLHSGDTPEDRAKLALRELIRAGGFERSTLIVATPTGTGWMDPAGVDPIEYLHDGDVATVGVQYSYLASWLSLFVEPGYGADSARALFSEVYGYWTKLPKDRRPKLYLFGLSLGTLSSEQSNELFEVLADPYQGALWAGPPFPSRIWNWAEAGRDPATPQWLPRFHDGSYIRFTGLENALAIPGATWGPMRVVYLQYPSDPIVFFSTSTFYREPDWMKPPRGADVSPQLRWYPIVTGLQLAVDMMIATTAPIGHGHVYAPQNYIDAWAEVTAVDWPASEIERLKRHLAGRYQ
jgi:uncharacterized membrane protein